ncbi:MAG: hypothetical protein ACREOD_08730 [Candidatus Dormibacteria bacterium]
MRPKLPLGCRLALALYPPRFRARYGEELAVLAQATLGQGPVTRDLARGALRAWRESRRLARVRQGRRARRF